MELVVNEWLPEYLRPSATEEQKSKLENFLNKFIERNDKLFIRANSPFLRKILRLSKDYNNCISEVNNVKRFIKLIYLDSDGCVIVDDDEINLEDQTRDLLIAGGNTESDIYLFESASITSDRIVITTDAKLKNHLLNDNNYKVEMLDDFLAFYLNNE